MTLWELRQGLRGRFSPRGFREILSPKLVEDVISQGFAESSQIPKSEICSRALAVIWASSDYPRQGKSETERSKSVNGP